MNKLANIAGALALVMLLVNAKCNDCDKAKATVVAVCQAMGEESEACKTAKAEAVKACSPNPVPTPTPTPTPPPVDPPPTPPTTCVPECASDEKCVEHGAVEKTYTCEKVPGPPASGLIPDEELTPGPDVPQQMWGQVDAAINRWRTIHPEKWRADGACLINGAAGIDAAFEGIATELGRQGIVAGQSITKSGQRSDALFVNVIGTKRYEEWHLFDYARGCVATGPNAFKGVYIRDGEGTVPPPTSDACPYEPCPVREWTVETLPPGWDPALVGQPSYVIQWHAHTMGNNDSTPTVQRQCSFCNAVMNDPNRCGCPVRPDGHVERVPVENWLMYGGFTRDSRNGQDCTPNNTDNPAAWLAGTGNCRMCNAKKNVCTDWN